MRIGEIVHEQLLRGEYSRFDHVPSSIVVPSIVDLGRFPLCTSRGFGLLFFPQLHLVRAPKFRKAGGLDHLGISRPYDDNFRALSQTQDV